VRHELSAHRRLRVAHLASLATLLSLCAIGCSSNDDPEQPPPDDNTNQQPPPGSGGTGGDVTPPPTNTNTEPPPPPPIDKLERAQFEALLERACGQCHGPDAVAVQGGINYINNLDELIASGRIVPGNPEESLIYQRIDRGEMPPEGAGTEVTAAELDQLATFIAGLKAPPAADCTDQFVSFDDVYGEIQRDIVSQEADERVFIRYLGVSNRYNAGVCSQDLESERWSMSKLVNSLSTETGIRKPVAIDRNNLIYRIDIRDYGWDREVTLDNQLLADGTIGSVVFADGWEAIIASSDFAVEFEGDEADTIKELTETTVPYLFADAFVEQASVGELYYGLVDVPLTKDELLLQLDVDVQENFDQEIVVRAGFTNSAISLQDRVVERHPQGLGGGGVFWDSFDFDPDVAGESIFVDPFDFNEGGSESLFSLPNGLHAYVIFDANGVRQAETNLIVDKQQEDFIVRSAVSCMTCHAAGLNVFTDQVRGFAEDNVLEFDADEIELLREVYPSKTDMDRIIEEDRDLYNFALSRVGVPTAERRDPISDSFVRFNKDVKASTAAGDVHFPLEQFKDNVNRFDRALAGFRTDFVVDRDDWTGEYLATLCVVSAPSRNRPLQADCDVALATIE
jgi:mono/diheme cytochrome c family protein